MSRWAGRQVTTARANWMGRVKAGQVQCCRCGGLVTHDPTKRNGGWQVDHYPISREMGGTTTWPAHSHCNESAGGKRGAQITNARRASTTERMTSERARNIRGI